MKIGMCFLRLSNGGGSYQLINLARQLQLKGHQVTIVTYFRPEQDFHRNNLKGLMVVDCGVEYRENRKIEWQPVGLVRYYWSIVKMVWSMYQRMKNLDFEVVNPHEWLADYPAVWYKWWHPGTRIVWMCNDVWHIPGNEEMPEKRLLFRWIHMNVISNFDRYMVKYIDKVTVLDHRIESIVQHFYSNLEVRVIRSGVDLNLAKNSVVQKIARKRLDISAEDYVVVCFSIFYRHRRFEDVILAIREIRETVGEKLKLIIVGSKDQDPDYVKEIEKLVINQKLEETVSLVTRYVTPEEKTDYLSLADIFVYPNQFQTWGLIVIEAMLTGLPCIVSTGAGVHEIIEEGRTGLTYPVTDWQALAGRLKYAYQHRPAMKRIGQAAKVYVEQNLSWSNYAKAMEKVFRS